MTSSLRPLACAFLVASAVALRAQSVSYDDAVTHGKALIAERNYPAALLALKVAVATDATRHPAYLQLAIASYRADDLAAAEDYAKASLERAPESESAAIREVLGVIVDKRKFLQLEQDGDAAYAVGLMAKAAESYRQAFELFPNRGAVGLRAAGIYADSLNRLLDAAILWEKVAASDDRDSVSVAREELKRRSSELNQLASSRLAALQQKKSTPDLVRLTQAFPSHLGIRLETAAAFATQADVAAAAQHLAQANKLGLKPDTLVARKEFQDLITAPATSAAFSKFVQDAYGDDVGAALRAEKQKADAEAERKAREARAAKEAAAKAERDRQEAARQAAARAEAQRQEQARLAAERQAREERARQEREDAYRRAQFQQNNPPPAPAPVYRRSSDASFPGMK
jgi:tetratricopeptide (TPR) repeat protein